MIRGKSQPRIRLRLLTLIICAFFLLPSAIDAQEQDIEVLKQKIIATGKLPFKKEVSLRFMDKPRMKKYLADYFDRKYSDQLAGKEALFMKLMGFVIHKPDVKNIRKRIHLSNVAGGYNPETKELLALNQYRSANYIHAMMLIHELRHALQDQHFNLNSPAFKSTYSDFDDRRLAVLAAVEGDATLLMVLCSEMNPDVLTASPDADALFSLSPVAKNSVLYNEPPIFRHQLQMPYLHGLRFVTAVFKKKKWKGVNRILKNPPDSSEQVLHPEKYLKREKPIAVAIQYTPQDYRLYHSGVIGEYLLNVLVTPKDSYVNRDYAQGWGGDTFHIYTRPDSGNYFLAWECMWDKYTFCASFYEDLKRFLEKQYKINFKKGSIKNRNFIAGKAQNSGDYFFLMKWDLKLFFARSNDKNQMNLFIYGGNYD